MSAWLKSLQCFLRGYHIINYDDEQQQVGIQASCLHCGKEWK